MCEILLLLERNRRHRFSNVIVIDGNASLMNRQLNVHTTTMFSAVNGSLSMPMDSRYLIFDSVMTPGSH